MSSEAPLGLGIVGAGGFARFLASAANDLPDVKIVAVVDTDSARADRFAHDHGARVVSDPGALLRDERVEAVVIATTPDTHASLSLQALAAGRHVFCEKPVALNDEDARAVSDAVTNSGLTYVVDHVLRYNPVLAALVRLGDAGLLPDVQRFAFDNDAVDEDLGHEHWFWDDALSGGILLEHGVHFFDAAAMLIGSRAEEVQAMSSARPDGRTDLVVCTVAHAGGALATHAHGFSHALRAERQLMRVDYGLAEARIHGWIPLRAEVRLWTDRVEAFEQLRGRAAELLAVPGVRPCATDDVTITIERDAAPPATIARGVPRTAPHRVDLHIDLGFPGAKDRVYRESVRAALLDLATCARTGALPRADIAAGSAAVHVASAGTRALHDHHTHRITTLEMPCPALG